MKPKVIKTEQEYEDALRYIETLMDAEPGSAEEEELELFSVIIEEYEEQHYPIEPPDPIDAILFRMDQQELTRKDLTVYIGSQSKVSEVLNGKRNLSLRMIRNLHEGLGIPADILLKEPGKKIEPAKYVWSDFPFTTMLKQGYFGDWSGTLPAAKDVGEELLTKLFSALEGLSPESVYCRRTQTAIDENALHAWHARALSLVQKRDIPDYDKNLALEPFIKKVVRASYFDEGPSLAVNLLWEHGIHFVILEHLPKTYLDGAAFIAPSGHPVIGMTLRHDRLDNFWFTLLHELGHVFLHLGTNGTAFFDETDHEPCEDDDPRELEANTFARDALIPNDMWQEHSESLLTSASAQKIRTVSNQLEISPAIVAGRIRWESGDYSRHSRLIGKNVVKKQLCEITAN